MKRLIPWFLLGASLALNAVMATSHNAKPAPPKPQAAAKVWA